MQQSYRTRYKTLSGPIMRQRTRLPMSLYHYPNSTQPELEHHFSACAASINVCAVVLYKISSVRAVNHLRSHPSLTLMHLLAQFVSRSLLIRALQICANSRKTSHLSFLTSSVNRWRVSQI